MNTNTFRQRFSQARCDLLICPISIPHCCWIWRYTRESQITDNLTVKQSVRLTTKKTSKLYITLICPSLSGKCFYAETSSYFHDDVIKWKHFPRYRPFVRVIHRSPVNSPHKGQWRGALMFSLICAWINGWVNNRETGDLRRHRAYWDVIVILRKPQ